MIATVFVVPVVIAPASALLDLVFVDVVDTVRAGAFAGACAAVVAADLCAAAACAAVAWSAVVSAGPALPAATRDSTVESSATTARAPSQVLPGAGRPGMMRFLNSELIEPLLLLVGFTRSS